MLDNNLLLIYIDKVAGDKVIKEKFPDLSPEHYENFCLLRREMILHLQLFVSTYTQIWDKTDREMISVLTHECLLKTKNTFMQIYQHRIEPIFRHLVTDIIVLYNVYPECQKRHIFYEGLKLKFYNYITESIACLLGSLGVTDVGDGELTVWILQQELALSTLLIASEDTK